MLFFTTWVKKLDKDDWGKLKQVLNYLKGTRHMKLMLSAENIEVIRWEFDALYNNMITAGDKWGQCCYLEKVCL